MWLGAHFFVFYKTHLFRLNGVSRTQLQFYELDPIMHHVPTFEIKSQLFVACFMHCIVLLLVRIQCKLVKLVIFSLSDCSISLWDLFMLNHDLIFFLDKISTATKTYGGDKIITFCVKITDHNKVCIFTSFLVQ